MLEKLKQGVYEAEMTYRTEQLNPAIKQVGRAILNKHYLKKHGTGAYYGQK